MAEGAETLIFPMKHAPKIVFFGTPQFATVVLDELVTAKLPPALIVTAPDRPAGRKLALTPPPVKVWAMMHDIDVLQPESVREKDFLGELQNTEWDLFVVVAYGQIFSKELLAIPQRGCLNIHYSLLPKLRGASPVQSAILMDERRTGVSIIEMKEKLDAGGIVAQASIEPEPWPPTTTELLQLLTQEGAKLLTEVIPLWLKGEVIPALQDDSEATYCTKITKEDARIDLSKDAYQNYLKIRAFDSNPRAFFIARKDAKDVRVNIVDAEYKEGALALLRVIPEGKKEMPYEEFLRGGYIV